MKSVSRAAFTLVELLVVLAIIAIVIAIVVPVLGRTRDSAKAVSTGNQLKQITTAASVFFNDEKRMPGYFTPRQMGNAQNLTQGMSAMENVMLDLAGFKPAGTGTTNPITVGPTTNTSEQITIDFDSIGSPGGGTKLYYTPDKKLFVPQNSSTGQQIGAAGHTASSETAPQLFDVVDYFYQPLLAWVSDDTYVTRPGTQNYNFSRADSGNGTQGAKMYWNSNACFLNATALGKKGVDQTIESMISPAGANATKSLEGAFGNPRDPYRDPQNLNALSTVVARTARSAFIVQSAGLDGTYFGKKDRGAKQFASGFIDYRMNFAPNPTQPVGPSNQYVDKDGKPTNEDVIEKFDDLFSYSSN